MRIKLAVQGGLGAIVTTPRRGHAGQGVGRADVHAARPEDTRSLPVRNVRATTQAAAPGTADGRAFTCRTRLDQSA
jgi:hypothetical protein